MKNICPAALIDRLFRTAKWIALGIACIASAPIVRGQSHCMDYWTAAYKCSQGCGSCGGSSSGGGYKAPSYDYGAAQRAQQAAAAAEAERQRQAEAERIERERQAELKRQKDAEFIRNRDKTILKGSVGASLVENEGGLKGSRVVSAGLKELSPGDRPAPGIQGAHSAWKQLNCAAALSGYALAAVKQTQPDYQESTYLLAQASNALNGQTLNVECPATAPFPDLRGRKVDMEQAKDSEKKIIERAVVVVARMKQRSEPAEASPVPAKNAPESADEKVRRVQRELNQANSQKITGQTKADIDAQEQDRKELTKLILANERLEKGDFSNVIADTQETARTRRKPASLSK